jgi:hypothetical protein
MTGDESRSHVTRRSRAPHSAPVSAAFALGTDVGIGAAMNVHRFLASLSFAGLWLAACGGSTSSGGTNAPVAASDFASGYAHAVCDNVAGCCQKAGLGYDANACMTSVQGIIQGLLVNPANAAGATYDPNAAGDCLAQVRAAVETCSTSTSSKNALDSACQRVYAGKSQPGGTCTSSVDCAPTTDGTVTCEIWSSSGSDGGSQSGSQCQVRKTPKGGEPCGGTTSGGAPPTVVGACEFGESDTFTCDYQTHTCQPRGAIGATCESTDNCVTTAYCTNGSCAARVGVGGACDGFSDSCDATSRCDQSTKQCVAKLADGTACTLSSDCAGGSCSSGKCRSSDYADPTVCGGTAH